VAVLAATTVLAACGRDGDPAALPPATTRGGTAAASISAPATTTPAPATTRPPAPVASPSTSAAPATTATATTAGPPAFPTVHAVSTTSVHLVDTSRPTVSRGRTIAPSRTLDTTVYAPSDGGPYPLVVFAHGFQIGPGPYAHLCQVLASAGYVVAAPAFPLTDQAVAGANLDRGDLPNQAGDVSFVITSLTSSPPAALTGKVDGAHVGVVGHSDGADTVLDVGYFPFRNDTRVRAVAAFAPDAMTPPGGSVGAGVPLLLEHGDHDSIVPFSNSQTVFGQVPSHRFFLVMHGADHLPPVQGVAPWAPVLERTTIAFLDRYVAGRASTDDGITAAATSAGPSVATLASAG
jgi:predicted dienelactone hydrolase